MFKLVALAAMIHSRRIRTPREPNPVHRAATRGHVSGRSARLRRRAAEGKSAECVVKSWANPLGFDPACSSVHCVGPASVRKKPRVCGVLYRKAHTGLEPVPPP